MKKMVDIDENGVVIYEKDQGNNVYVALFYVALCRRYCW